MKEDRDFETLVAHLRQRLKQALPGEEAQYRMVPAGRPRLSQIKLNRRGVRDAGVMAILEKAADEPRIILTQRQTYPGVHSGQVSLPGGRYEASDPDFLATALRETEEEIALPRQALEVLSPLSELYIPPSKFYVYPFLALSHQSQALRAEEREVASIHRPSVRALLDPNNEILLELPQKDGSLLKVPAFKLDELMVWGATAMILSEVKSLLSPSV